MARSSGQSSQPNNTSGLRGPASASTREQLLAAAGALIAELGWGRVTTRAVAERAGLPHGSVSYHFRGKQELLAEAAMHAFQQAIPADRFAELATVEDLIGLIAAEVGDIETIDPVLSRLMLESMREAERDPALRVRMGTMMGEYRNLMVETVRADQQRGAVFADAPADAIATLIAAVGDGLLLHVLLDPEVDTSGAVEALRALLNPR
jgi:AcrR family transcriptional regulator